MLLWKSTEIKTFTVISVTISVKHLRPLTFQWSFSMSSTCADHILFSGDEGSTHSNSNEDHSMSMKRDENIKCQLAEITVD